MDLAIELGSEHSRNYSVTMTRPPLEIEVAAETEIEGPMKIGLLLEFQLPLVFEPSSRSFADRVYKGIYDYSVANEYPKKK